MLRDPKVAAPPDLRSAGFSGVLESRESKVLPSGQASASIQILQHSFPLVLKYNDFSQGNVFE